tara:strand:+ start:102 stop:449 length:348 start_codon:yes stop_codon:yes gene_type:complete
MTEKMTLEMANKRVTELELKMADVMKRLEIVVTESEPKKSKNKSVEKDKKKRGMTGYLLYAKEKRSEVKDSLVKNGNETPKPTEVMTEVAKSWKNMSSDEQAAWNEKAKSVVDDE